MSLRAVEEVWVIGGLLEFHGYNRPISMEGRISVKNTLTNVQQADVVIAIGALDEARKVLREDVLVEMRLQGTHFYPENTFALCRQRCQNIAFQPSKHQ